MRSVLLLAVCSSLATGLAAGAAACTLTAHVDRHLARTALDASYAAPVLGWVLSPGCAGSQTSFEVALLHQNGTALWRGGTVRSNRSQALPAASWSAELPAPALQPATAYQVLVGVTLRGAKSPVWGGPTPFLTALSPVQLTSASPLWAANGSAQFVMLRRTLSPASGAAATYLTITARPTPDWNMPHGRNTSHLLGAYKLWVNGVPLGAGPGRMVGGAIAADSYNITSLVADGSSVLAVEAYYQQSHQPQDGDFGGVMAWIHHGDGHLTGEAAEHWKAFDASAAFGPAMLPGRGAGTGSYVQPHENINGALYPHGWRGQSYSDAGWASAVSRPPFEDRIAPRAAMPVSLRRRPAATFLMLEERQDSDGQPWYRYRIDFGRNIQGHVNVSFLHSIAGRNVTVALGEQVKADGSVVYKSLSRNTWIDTWTLGGAPNEEYVPHEYCEFRWAEISGAPEPPEHDRVAGWQVHYPFDGKVEPNDQEGSFLTSFGSSSADLNAVFELARYTIEAASLDLNTDSNTRQRDLCTLDAYLATKYQGGVAPGSSYHLRKRVTEIMYEPNGYVNYWSEFLISHIGALFEYTIEYEDTQLARLVWNESFTVPLQPGKHIDTPVKFSMENYSLEAYFNVSSGLVERTPNPLVDWPRSNELDTDDRTSAYCDDMCVQMNAYAVITHQWMSIMASKLGLDAKANEYQARAARIRSMAERKFSTSSCNIEPLQTSSNGIRCYRDSLGADYTSATASALAGLARLEGTAQGVLALVPFLRARNGRRGKEHGLELSGWMTGFMLEAIYSAAGEIGEGGISTAAVKDAVEYAYSVLVNQGNNSWMSMIRQNATMTMESWVLPPLGNEGGGTLSHPWTAAPAFIVPRYLMGIRPLEDGWSRVAVRPLPAKVLDAAAIHVPTLRGTIDLSFRATSTAFVANISVPGNTKAHVCLPRYLYAPSSTCSLKRGGLLEPSHLAGALVCLNKDLGGGQHTLMLECVASAAPLTIPHFKQCDPRWGADVIGTRGNTSDDSTICRVGCAMTSLAMLLAGLDVPTSTVRPLAGSLDPGSLNTWLRWNGGYDCVDVRPDDPVCFNLVSAAVRRLTPKVTFQGYVSPAPALSQMAAALRPRNADQNPLSAEKAYLAHVHDSHHFVLVTGVTDSGVRVLDPFFNTSFYPYANVSGALVFLLHTATDVVDNTTEFVPFTYPTFKQCDGRWGADLIETTTVCKVGCLMSSTSMALAGHGIDVAGKGADPGSLNTWLRTHKGYTPTNDFEESAIDAVSSLLPPGAVTWPKDGKHSKNDLNWTVLKEYLAAQPPRVVIANVLHGHHFVLTVGLSGDGDTILVNDPGFDKTNYSYSKDVVGWRIFDMTTSGV